jgi:transposase
MGQAKAVSPETQNLIVRAVNQEMTCRRAAEIFYVSKSSVSNIVKRYNERGGVVVRKSTGRPPKTTLREDRDLVNESKRFPRKTAAQLLTTWRAKYKLNCSVSTAKRRLRNAGLFGRRLVKKPRISVKNRIARLKFAKDHLGWTAKDWAKVL